MSESTSSHTTASHSTVDVIRRRPSSSCDNTRLHIGHWRHHNHQYTIVNSSIGNGASTLCFKDWGHFSGHEDGKFPCSRYVRTPIRKTLSKDEVLCTAKVGCYHILVARLAIGTNEDMPHCKLNLTTLWSNKRKRQYKKSERKCPRIDDVDIIPAGDAAVMDDVEPEPAADEPAADDVDTAPAASTSATVNNDLCYSYNCSEPPARKGRKPKSFYWVDCDKCHRWYHTTCVGMKCISPSYACNMWH